jgi:NAD(P)-dependent dehydrogenase (short-subunit alcohol dehydrogenase family)
VRLLELGATVHILDLNPLDEKVHAPYPTTGGKFYVYTGVDVTSREKVRDTFQKIFSISPNLYGIVKNAGVNLRDREDGFLQSDETFYRTMEVCAYGTWHCATELFRYYMAKNKPYPPETDIGINELVASVVNIGSTAPIMGTSESPHYTGAKHAVMGLTRTWAIDLAPYGIRCNAVLPSVVASAGLMNALAQGQLGDIVTTLRSQSSLKRFAEPREIADSVVFLLSNHSAFITGQYLSPNGGYPHT